VMTCPTTAAFDGLPKTKRKMKVGSALGLFGDGFQKKDVLNGRRIWRIPTMEGEFVVENKFGTMRAVAGGLFLILAENSAAGLKAAELAVEAISQRVKYVVLPFPGGICRSGSKLGSMKYKLGASTNQYFCPKLRSAMADSKLSEEINSVYEVVMNGLDLNAVKQAMAEGIRAAAEVSGVLRITASNFGGKLGPYKVYLKEVLGL